MSAAVPYILTVGKTVKEYWSRDEASEVLLRLAQELGCECKIKWEGKTEVESQVSWKSAKVLVKNNGGEDESWPLMTGRRHPLTGDALAKAIKRILEE